MENREEEIFDFLYNVMNGDEKDSIVTKDKNEFGEPITAQVPVSMSLRMKAAELLFKSVGDSGKGDAAALPVVICEDI